jgi:hypothetical protein
MEKRSFSKTIAAGNRPTSTLTTLNLYTHEPTTAIRNFTFTHPTVNGLPILGLQQKSTKICLIFFLIGIHTYIHTYIQSDNKTNTLTEYSSFITTVFQKKEAPEWGAWRPREVDSNQRFLFQSFTSSSLMRP